MVSRKNDPDALPYCVYCVCFCPWCLVLVHVHVHGAARLAITSYSVVRIDARVDLMAKSHRRKRMRRWYCDECVLDQSCVFVWL
jgi:hypothetical protein